MPRCEWTVSPSRGRVNKRVRLVDASGSRPVSRLSPFCLPTTKDSVRSSRTLVFLQIRGRIQICVPVAGHHQFGQEQWPEQPLGNGFSLSEPDHVDTGSHSKCQDYYLFGVSDASGPVHSQMSRSRYEPPLDLPRQSSSSSDQVYLRANTASDPFSFEVVRKSTSRKLFDTSIG